MSKLEISPQLLRLNLQIPIEFVKNLGSWSPTLMFIYSQILWYRTLKLHICLLTTVAGVNVQEPIIHYYLKLKYVCTVKYILCRLNQKFWY